MKIKLSKVLSINFELLIGTLFFCPMINQLLPDISRVLHFSLLCIFTNPLDSQVVDESNNKEPIRILCIGDSITQGGKRDREEYTYRFPLFQMLTDTGIAFDFIGTRKKGLQSDAKWPDYKGEPFDPDHEGYYGAKTAKVRDLMKVNLPTLPPADFALIHLGTNDQKSEDHKASVQLPLREIIELLRNRNPKVTILLGHLNFNGGVAKSKIRPLVEELVEFSTPDSKVATVHHYKGWNERPDHPATDTFDWAHPNPQGQRKMAAKWFDAMQLVPGLVQGHPDLLIIDLDQEGKIFLDTNPMTKDELIQEIKKFITADPSRSVQILAEKTLQFKSVVEMISLCKEHGVENVTLSTKN